LHEQRDRRVHEATAGPVADVSPHGVSGRQRLFFRVSPCSGCETGHPSPPFALRSGDNLYVPRT
ncbi:MAG: hypothetical protein, partial [Olavius algarvensis Gamma 1 endosymbiont]